MKKFFEEVIPDYDRNRFYVSHMKKVLEWFKLLRDNDALDFEEEDAVGADMQVRPDSDTAEENAESNNP